MGRIGRSFHLVGQSYRILMQDKELMVLPLLSGIVMAAIIGGVFIAGLGFDERGLRQSRPEALIPAFLLYVATYTVGIFFQAAVIAGATERLRGGDPTVGSALAAAGRRLGAIILWALVAATVGMILRTVQERLGFVGRIVIMLVGAAWSFATFFVVPVLVLEDRSIGGSFTRSVDVFKRTWGESIAGATGLGAAAVCAWLTLVAVVGLLVWAGVGLLALAIGGVGAILLGIFFSTLQGVYVASLFRYATDGQTASGFDADALAHAFVQKRR